MKKHLSTLFSICFVFSLLIFNFGCAQNNKYETEPPDYVNALFKLIDKRLSLMPSVAAYKWQHQLAISDPKREEVVLDKAVAGAESKQLDTTSIHHFFSIQIQLAKSIQQKRFSQWQQKQNPQQVQNLYKDLNHELRPELIGLGKALNHALYLAAPRLNNPFLSSNDKARFMTMLGHHQLSDQELEQLWLALIRVSRADKARAKSTLQDIKNKGVIRIGTTGDYYPFSYFDKKKQTYTGIDIELALSLANYLNVDLQFIHTSWPTLMQDLKDNQFDIAMSGISINLARQKSAFFSKPYHQGGKSIITQCQHKQKFSSLEKVDKATTKVVVNPGGTNEKFVRQNLKHAQIIVHPDNRTIFEQIKLGNVNLMITDAIEIAVQESKGENLCNAMEGLTLNHTEKGFLLPQDLSWKQAVDLWLAQANKNGLLKASFDQHL